MLAAMGSVGGFFLVSHRPGIDGSSTNLTISTPMNPFRCLSFRTRPSRPIPTLTASAKGVSSSSSVDQEEAAAREDAKAGDDDEARTLRRSADWRATKAYKESGVIFDGRIEGFNNGGLLIRFYSLIGFLPFPLLSPSHSCKDAQKTIQDIAKELVGSSIGVKVIEASEEEKKLIFSEKDAVWSKFSSQVKVGDVFDGRVGSVEDYGAFVHLRFPDGGYHLTGLVHVSEVSWDLVQDVKDFLNEGDQVKIKVIHIDRDKSRITLSIKQLEDDPLLETLDKVIPQVVEYFYCPMLLQQLSLPMSLLVNCKFLQEGQSVSDSLDMSSSINIEPLPGLESICKELLQEDGITDVRFGRQGLEKRVVSQDLELWLSNVPAKDKQFTLLARAGRQVQEVYVTATLDQEGIKKAVQRVLGRVP